MKTNRHSTWPLFALPARGRRSERKTARSRAAPEAGILVPIDFSAASRKALEFATTVGSRFRMPLTLVHVVKPFTCQTDCGYGPVTRQIPDQPEVRKARARLKRLARKLSGVPRPAEIQVLSGTAPFEITQAAKALGTDLIIMACHGTREAPNHIGRIAEAVVRQAPCPVFVLREKELESRK